MAAPNGRIGKFAPGLMASTADAPPFPRPPKKAAKRNLPGSKVKTPLVMRPAPGLINR